MKKKRAFESATDIIKSSIWKTSSVNKQASVTLVRWRVVEVKGGQRHLIGFCVENQEGRVSTSIEVVDPHTTTVLTRSGRVYRLSGKPGYDSDGEYVWKVWAQINNITSEKDVTHEVEVLLAGRKTQLRARSTVE